MAFSSSIQINSMYIPLIAVSKMIFPQFGMYAPSNHIGNAMQNVYGYTYTGKVAHDDAPDSLALYAKRFIMGGGVRLAEISIFSR